MPVLLERVKTDVNNYVKQCVRCRHQKQCPLHYTQLHTEVPSALIHFIVMDLTGMFKPSPQDHQYALTVIDMLTDYT